MCVGTLAPPSVVEIEAGDRRAVIATASARLEIDLASLRLRILDAAGRTMTEVGGPEKRTPPNAIRRPFAAVR